MPVALVENAPQLGLQFEGVRQGLKHHEPDFVGSIPVPSHGCERERVRSIVGEIELTFRREPRLPSIYEPLAARAQQAIELPLIGWLGFQHSGFDEIIQLP